MATDKPRPWYIRFPSGTEVMTRKITLARALRTMPGRYADCTLIDCRTREVLWAPVGASHAA